MTAKERTHLLRLWSATSAVKYARSFYRIVDLLAVLPTYVAVILPASRYFKACAACGARDLAPDAIFCKQCGAEL